VQIKFNPNSDTPVLNTGEKKKEKIQRVINVNLKEESHLVEQDLTECADTFV
jgi:hypothetical protein